MDSCPLAAITETPRGNDLSKDGNEVEVTSLEEAKSVIAALRARQRAQAHQMLAWRRTLKLQVRREIRKKKKRTRNNGDQSEPRRAQKDGIQMELYTRTNVFLVSFQFLQLARSYNENKRYLETLSIAIPISCLT